MIEMGLIPVLAVLALCGLCLIVSSRRSAQVAAMRTDLDEMASSVMVKDRANDATLIEAIVDGTPVDECISRYSLQHARLFPGPHLRSEQWTLDDLERWKKQECVTRQETVNRGLLAPAFGIAIVIVAACVVSLTLLYSFHSRNETSFAASPSAAPMPTFPDPLPTAATTQASWTEPQPSQSTAENTSDEPTSDLDSEPGLPPPKGGTVPPIKPGVPGAVHPMDPEPIKKEGTSR